MIKIRFAKIHVLLAASVRFCYRETSASSEHKSNGYGLFVSVACILMEDNSISCYDWETTAVSDFTASETACLFITLICHAVCHLSSSVCDASVL